MSDPTPLPADAPGRSRAAAALVARLVLGGVFVFSAVMKLDQPLLFAQAMTKFKVVDLDAHDHLIKIATFAVPWTELFCGVALILGMWTRAAALLLAAALASFTVLIVQTLQRGEAFECSCFGRLRLVCPAKLSWCNVGQNSVLFALALALLVGGAGRWSLDRLIGPVRPKPPAPPRGGVPDRP
jgi:uncharacterized membrane protein YphA (DoxX/SURF4 family)